MTPFSCLCRAAGLTLPAASDWLDVSLDTTRSWSSGRRTAPADAIARLANLVRLQEKAARRIVDDFSRDPRKVSFVPPDDVQAKREGFPNAEAWSVCLGRAMAMAGVRFDIAEQGDLP